MRLLLAIWACFLLRLSFYAAFLPLFEGWDEYAHFAVIRAMAVGDGPLVARDHPLPRDLEAALQLAPGPNEYDAFWQLPPEVREQRVAAFWAMPANWSREQGTGQLQAYEALQPPLYYWIMTPVVRLMSGRSLAAQMMAVRWWGCLIGSLVVPLVFLVGREVFRDDAVALGCAAVVAVMPELAIDLARVSNEALAVPLFTLLIWLGLRSSRWSGVAFGFGLITKVYFLAAAPLSLLRKPRVAALLSIPIAGWWFIYNLRTTGTLTGLSESVMLKGTSAGTMLARASEVHWFRAIDAIFLSHLYYGGWSGLTVRSWMYHLFYAVILVSGVGLLACWRSVRGPILIYAAFWLAQLYNVLILYLTKGMSTSMGWYMYAVVAAEVVLCVAGLRQIPGAKRWATFGGVVLLVLLDLYTVHAVAAPYYAGLVPHRLAWRGSGAAEILPRLAEFKPFSAAVLAVFWAAYLVATLALLGSQWHSARSASSGGTSAGTGIRRKS